MSIPTTALVKASYPMSYPGGKNGAGVYQTLINRMPPHTAYIEPFLGSGAIMRLKRPAWVSIGIDRDPEVIQQWQDLIVTSIEGRSHHVNHDEAAQICTRHSCRGCSIALRDESGSANGSAGDISGRLVIDDEVGSCHISAGDTSGSAPRQHYICEIPPRQSCRCCRIVIDDEGRSCHISADDTAGSIVIAGEQRSCITSSGDGARFQFHVGDGIAFMQSYPFTGTELVYCDPPYLPATRRDLAVYRFEMDEAQHRRLLDTVRALPCLVLVSGYWSALYAEKLADWHTSTYQAMTRGGYAVTEWLWCNYPAPLALHDYRYLGTNFRERERIKRKKHRWVQRLQHMPALERQAMLAAIEEAWA